MSNELTYDFTVGSIKLLLDDNSSIDKFTRLLNLGGFDYRKSESTFIFSQEIEIDTREYFDMDKFMSIIDLLNYDILYKLMNCFLNELGQSRGEFCGMVDRVDRTVFLDDLLANLV